MDATAGPAPGMPKSLEGDGTALELSAWENFLRSPHTVIRLPGQPAIKLATDRVRARPAVSPNLSMMIGVNAIGLGVWGLFFANGVKKALGVRSPPGVVRAIFGARELWSGYSLAGDPTRVDVLWARVAADAFDIAALAALAGPSNPKRGNARLALGAVLGIAALDLVTAVRMSTVQRNCA
jgi:hypothetical protein